MSFPRYPHYKHSGVEWLGEVPKHWEVRRLKHNVRLVTEKSSNQEHPIALENIESWSGRLIKTDAEFQGEGVAFEAGDILFGKLRPYLAKVYVAEFAGEAVGDFHVMHPVHQMNGRFVFYQLLNREIISVVDGSTYGAKMPRASWEFMGVLSVATPPPSEQSAIVAFLDRETAKIDALIEEQKRLIELLIDKRHSVIAHAVTSGLDPKAPMKHSGVEWLGEVPKHWGVGTLTRVATRVVVGIAEAAVHAYVADGTPILRSTNIRPGRIVGEMLYVRPDFAADRNSKLIHGGDLVTVRTGHAGVTAVIPNDLDGCQCFTMLITSLNEASCPFFYCFWLNSVVAQHYFSIEAWGSAQPNISVPILKATPVPIPPFREQNEIVRHLDRETSKIDALSHEADNTIALLKERRSALISAAVTGKIDVRELVLAEAEAA